MIPWGSPVPSFGDVSRSLVATLGLNPSNREFVDQSGRELQGSCRRFHTLRSLGLMSWSDVDSRHLRLILDSCNAYFSGNPYDRWFKTLDHVVCGTGSSFYDPVHQACHLDLIPYATAQKWTDLTTRQRSRLLAVSTDTLGILLRDSPIRTLILNGRSVVDQFQKVARGELKSREMPDWNLPRQAGAAVAGIAYYGVVKAVSGVSLDRRVLVLGYNHNLQSSYGVRTEVIQAIRSWIHGQSRTFDEASRPGV